MDSDFAPFRRPADAGWRAAPDFGALVAFLGAAQASQPTARRAVRLEAAGGETGDVAAALIALFAPNVHMAPASAVLRGRFNPAVPLSNAPLTPYKPL
ncbi:MAG: hypothetical protein ABR601_09805 [Parasphingopyxis sp.]